MRLSPAPKLLLIVFTFVIVVILVGAIWYKYAVTPTVTEPAASDTMQQETITELPLGPAVTLHLTAKSNNQYELSISDLTQPVSTLSFKLTSPLQAITASNISLESNLTDQGWSTAINTTADSESGQEFSFSMIRISPDKTLHSPSIVLGTLTLENTSDLRLDPEESKVTYATGEKGSMSLDIEPATIDN